MLRSRWLTAPEEYAMQIPYEYFDVIVTGELFAAEIIDVVGGRENTFGFYVADTYGGWSELVWFDVCDESLETVEKARFLSYCIRMEKRRNAGACWGVFTEMSPGELWPDTANVLSLAGMETSMVDGNVYELKLSDVTDKVALQKAANKLPCRSLGDVGEEILAGMSALMKKDERPVPLSETIDWNAYLPEISQVFIKNERNAGLLLISEAEGHLVIDLGYATNSMILPALLGSALAAAEEKYGGGMEVLVPVVVNKTAKITEHIAPNAKRGKLLQGISRVN